MGVSKPRIRLAGAAEIRELLGGISRQRAYQITSGPSFPKPVADLTQGKVWDTAEVEHWINTVRPERLKKTQRS